MTVLEVLADARARVERGWCQGDNARDADRFPVASWSLDACCWCMNGAISAAAPTSELSNEAWRLLYRVVNGSVATWNDAPGRTQAEVLAAFDRAMELARKEAA